MKARIRNTNIDVELEGDTPNEIMEEFARDYPSRLGEAVTIEWEEPDGHPEAITIP